MGNPVVHFEFYAKDIKAQSNFYAETFGWDMNAHEESGYVMFNTGSEEGIGGGGIQMDGEHEGMKPYITFYIQVDDLQESLAKVNAGGGQTIMPPMEIPGSKGAASMALFLDPEENVIGLYTVNDPDAVCDDS